MKREINPLVTIITVTFNLIKSGREEFFRQCLESVHNQTYKNVEHIIVDGASRDSTVDLIKEYAKKDWIKYISEPDNGIYEAMNKGIKMSKGKYIAFLNSDDFYHKKNGIEASVSVLEKNNADFSYASVIDLDEKNNIKKITHPKILNVFFTIVPNHQTMFMRRDILVREGMFNTKFKCVGDYDLTIRLCLKKYKSVFVKNIFSTYRLGGYSLEAQEKGIILKEVSSIYYYNYNRLCPITREESKKICGNIYCGSYSDIPLQLAKKLKGNDQYFDYKEYLKTNGFRNHPEKKNIPKLCSKVSIITITYNNPDLKRTLDSVLAQKSIRVKIEHIIVDNLSTDKTEEVVRNYKAKADFEVIYIREKDKGRYDAMNKGIRVTSGEYLMFLNAGDCFFNKNSLRKITNLSEKYDLIYGNLNVIENGKESIYYPPEIVDFKYFLSFALPHQSSLIKKDLFDKIGNYDDFFEIVSDWKFFLLAICKYDYSYYYINETISTYYFDGISSKVENSKKIEKEKNKVLNEEFSQIETRKIDGIKGVDCNDGFKTPILFLIFNRPDVSQKVFEEIRRQKPKHLFVAADGFRNSKVGEREKCQKTRDLLKKIDWDCELKTLFRDENFGCGRAVSGAISWFFDNVEEGIILEDDCLPDQSFFSYCEELLEKYRNDKRVSHINGTSFVCKKNTKKSYYFSKYYHVWGWATWRRAWNWYDYSMRNFPEFKSSNQIKNIFPNEAVQNFWLHCFEEIYCYHRDTWDFQWVYANFVNNGLSVMPYKNLVSNLGFGVDATHTIKENDKSANRSVETMGEINHPSFMVHDVSLDKQIYTSHLGLFLNLSNKTPDLPLKSPTYNVNKPILDSSQKVKIELNRIKAPRNLIKETHSKLVFAIFNPKKFIKKYYYKFLNCLLRQPARKIWYGIRGKKIKY